MVKKKEKTAVNKTINVDNSMVEKLYKEPSYYIDKFYLTYRGSVVRLTMGENIPEIKTDVTRVAATMTIESLKSLHQFIGEYIKNTEAKPSASVQ